MEQMQIKREVLEDKLRVVRCGGVQTSCCRENVVLHDLDDRYPHGIQQGVQSSTDLLN